jgi:hypothetical protein
MDKDGMMTGEEFQRYCDLMPPELDEEFNRPWGDGEFLMWYDYRAMYRSIYERQDCSYDYWRKMKPELEGKSEW